MAVRDPVRDGASLVDAFSNAWLGPAHIKGPLVIFVHGFTANALHLRGFAELASAFGFSAALFEHDSHVGIERSAAALAVRLSQLSDRLDRGFSLIGHSMGGLVAKRLAVDNSPQLRALVMLGSPNVASFNRPQLLAALIRAGEAIGPPKPFGRSVASQAARELAGVDARQLLKELSGTDIRVPVLSVSGGLAFVEFGRSTVGNKLANVIVQNLLSELPNDGLVPEASSDARRHVKGSAEHINDYSEYLGTNHSSLFKNQEVALRVMNWLLTKHQP